MQAFKNIHWASFAVGFCSAVVFAGFIMVVIVLVSYARTNKDLFKDVEKEENDIYSSDEIRNHQV